MIKIKILLVRPKPHKDSIGLQSFMICEPLELEYLYSYLTEFSHNVIILDMILEKKPLSYFIKKYQPDVVGFTSYITHVGVVKDYALEVKEINSKIVTVVGGVHAEVVPSDFEVKEIDYIIKVNALDTFKELLDNINRPVEVNKDLIKGIWKDNTKEYVINTNFNYPHPSRESTLKYRKKYNYIYHTKCATIKTSFGCPYNCEFCFCTKITQNKYFERDLNDVIDEIKHIKEKNIFIVDDNFLLKKDRVEEFCDLIKKNNIKKNYILFGRADFIANNDDVIKKIAEIGVQAIFVGIESFKDDELNNYQKKTNVEMNIKAISILEKHGIQCYSGIIVGLDWEKKDFNNLIKYLNSFKFPAAVNIQPITPMPGTIIYDYYQDQFIIPREKYELWDMAHLVLKPSKLSIRKFYYHIVRSYLKTVATFKSSFFIIKRYGFITYMRVFFGAMHILRQYLKLIIKGR